MANTWGTLELNIREYSRQQVSIYISEKKLLTAYDSAITKKPTTVLTGTGRQRRVMKVSGWLSRDDYSSLLNDKLSGVYKLATFNDGLSLNCYISKLNGNEQKGYNNIVWYEAEFIEK